MGYPLCRRWVTLVANGVGQVPPVDGTEPARAQSKLVLFELAGVWVRNPWALFQTREKHDPGQITTDDAAAGACAAMTTAGTAQTAPWVSVRRLTRGTLDEPSDITCNPHPDFFVTALATPRERRAPARPPSGVRGVDG